MGLNFPHAVKDSEMVSACEVLTSPISVTIPDSDTRPKMKAHLALATLLWVAVAAAAEEAEAEPPPAPGRYQVEGRLMKIERDPDPEWFRAAFVTVTGGSDTRYGFPT